MKLERERVAAGVGIMATLIGLTILFSLLDGGRIALGLRDVVLAIITGILWYILWPRMRSHHRSNSAERDSSTSE